MDESARPVVVVTGSSGGIGWATAQRFAHEGHAVVVNSVRSIAEGEARAASLSHGLYVQGDVASDDDCRRILDRTLDRFGRVDVLVNNAGTTEVIPHRDFDAVTDDVWHRILQVNLLGPWHMTRAFAPHLAASEDGAVVHVSSLAGVRPGGSSIPYAVSKAALNHLTALQAIALGPSVRVNAVAPAVVQTPWISGMDKVVARAEQAAPLKRIGTPEDLAQAIYSLATARHVTGQVVAVDGGLGLRT